MRLLAARYSIDTAPLIDLHRRHYPRDIFPSVWESIEELVGAGALVASEEVLHELEAIEDELVVWTRQHRGMLQETDDAVQREVQRILRSYPELVKERSPRQDADPFVIAVACVEGCSVVTSERRAGPGGRPAIPNVCDDIGVRCLSLLDMFREEGKTF